MFPVLSLAARVQNLVGRQGGTSIEDALLTGQLLYYAPHGTANPGVNSTYAVGLAGVSVACFHKRFSGVDVAIAHRYGQSPDTAPIHECAAWLLVKALGAPYDQLIPACVLRDLNSELGSLALGIEGQPRDPAPFAPGHPQGMAAAFIDALIAQQDRHSANFRWHAPSAQLHLIDHGYAFARPSDYCNASIFVQNRWRLGAQALVPGEQQALRSLLASADLFGLGGILESPRADSLFDRATWMLSRGEIGRVGDF
jgi:hypothetical protein